MAQETAKTRWPKIVSGIVDDVQLEMNESSGLPSRREEGQAIVQQLNQLNKDIQTDQVLR